MNAYQYKLLIRLLLAILDEMDKPLKQRTMDLISEAASYFKSYQ